MEVHDDGVAILEGVFTVLYQCMLGIDALRVNDGWK